MSALPATPRLIGTTTGSLADVLIVAAPRLVVTLGIVILALIAVALPQARRRFVLQLIDRLTNLVRALGTEPRSKGDGPCITT